MANLQLGCKLALSCAFQTSRASAKQFRSQTTAGSVGVPMSFDEALIGIGPGCFGCSLSLGCVPSAPGASSSPTRRAQGSSERNTGLVRLSDDGGASWPRSLAVTTARPPHSLAWILTTVSDSLVTARVVSPHKRGRVQVGPLKPDRSCPFFLFGGGSVRVDPGPDCMPSSLQVLAELSYSITTRLSTERRLGILRETHIEPATTPLQLGVRALVHGAVT